MTQPALPGSRQDSAIAPSNVAAIWVGVALAVVMIFAAQLTIVMVDRSIVQAEAFRLARTLADASASRARQSLDFALGRLDAIAAELEAAHGSAGAEAGTGNAAAVLGREFEQAEWAVAMAIVDPSFQPLLGPLTESGAAASAALAAALPQAPTALGQAPGAPLLALPAPGAARASVVLIRARPLAGGPHPGSRLAALVALDGLRTFGEQLDLRDGRLLSLVTPDGALLARAPAHAELGGSILPPGRPGFHARMAGEAVAVSALDGVTRFVAWRQVGPYPVLGMGALDRAVALASWWKLLWYSLGVAALLSLAPLAFGMFLQATERRRMAATRRAMEKLRALTAASQELGAILAPRLLAARAATLMRELVGCESVVVALTGEVDAGSPRPATAHAGAAPSGPGSGPGLVLPLIGDDGRLRGTITIHAGAERGDLPEVDRHVARQFARLVSLSLAGIQLLMELADKARASDRERDGALARQRYFTALLDGFREGIAAFDAEHRLVLCNPAFAELVADGDREALVGRQPEQLLQGLQGAMQQAAADGGAEKPFDLALPDRHMILECRLGLLAEGVALFARDVTALRRAELQKRQDNRLEAIGQLAGGIAHDFNNLLTVIVGNAEMLADSLPPDGPGSTQLDLIQRAADQASGLTSRLLAFARVDHAPPMPVDLAAVLGDFVPLLRTAVGEGAAIETDLATPLWPALANPGELRNAVLNLVLNARDATPAGGTIRLMARNVSIRPAEINGFMGMPGDFVRITVEDDGVGMTEEVRRRAFEPFFTTKTEGRGNGHGLAIVYAFVRNCGGHVDIISTAGSGATVRMYLPRAGAAQMAEAARASSASGGQEAILLIEDEADVRAQVEQMLRRLGYRVTSAESIGGALAALDRGLVPDAVVSDVRLSGGESGIDLVRRIRERMPHLPALFISGHVDPALIPDDPFEVMPRPLMKPFRRQQLAARMREMLEQGQLSCAKQ